MKKLFKNILYVFCCVAIASTVSGCSLKKASTSTTPKTFVIWSFEDEDVWTPVLKDIKKELSGYEVTYVKKTLSATYENDALNSILSGQGPDIWAMPTDWIYRHKAKLAPMPDSVVTSTKINLDDNFVSAIKDSVYFDSKIYGLSPTVNTLSVYYNAKLFDAALDEFQTANAINSKDSDAVKASKKTGLARANELLSGVPPLWTDFVEASKLITKKNGDTIDRKSVV